MIVLNRKEVYDKIRACWLGKNIGGTLGGPFEGIREVNDCTGYTTPPGCPLPNDDLDLQLIWLKAVRELGPENINAVSLGEYWLELITPYWHEYGISKANMRRGLVPPMSGQYKNHMKNSNGAWIRTEVWATLYPGDVEKAIHFSCEDACVDHGCGEGTYAAIFVTALEAAAFVVGDIRELIRIGLSKIPNNCRMHQYVTMVVDCYDKNMTWLEARNLITDAALADEEMGWFQAPTNVGYAIIGLLYGEGDFKKSMLIACNCGDDTDCTSSTVGSVLGIIHGTKIIPEDWLSYIGDDIVTIALNMGAGPRRDPLFPKTCTELTQRIIDLLPVTMRTSDVVLSDEPTNLEEFQAESMMGNELAMKLAARSEYYLTFSSVLSEGVVELGGEPEITAGGSVDVRLSIKKHFDSQKVFHIRWLLPEGWQVQGPKSISVMGHVPYDKDELVTAKADFVIIAGDCVNAENRVGMEISCSGHFEVVYVPIVLCS